MDSNSLSESEWEQVIKEIRQHTDLEAFNKETLISFIVCNANDGKWDWIDILDELCVIEKDWNDAISSK